MNSFELWWHKWTVYIMLNYNMDYDSASLVFLFAITCIVSIIVGFIKGIASNIERKKMKEAITSAISESKINFTTTVAPASIIKEEPKVTVANLKKESSEMDDIKKRLEEIRRQKEKLGSK